MMYCIMKPVEFLLLVNNDNKYVDNYSCVSCIYLVFNYRN